LITTVSGQHGTSSAGCWGKQIQASKRLMTSPPSVDMSIAN